MLLPKTIHPSWQAFLTADILCQLETIEAAIGDNYTPSLPKILKFLSTDLDAAHVVILGQDVYFQPNVATGRSFEVGGMVRWDEKFKQVSLKNIIRLIHKSYRGYEDYDQILKYSDILKEMASGAFVMKQPPEWFNSLENQGVLFLNSYFTCQVGRANSHRHIWQPFSEALFTYISHRRPDLIWFLWGKEAQEKKAYIKHGIFFESRHPMMCSSKFEGDFLKGDCFKATFHLIQWLGE